MAPDLKGGSSEEEPDQPNLVRAAFLAHRGKRLLVLGMRRGATPPGAEGLMAGLPWAGIDRLVTLPHIPLDRRHNAKIDYPALLRAISTRYTDI